MASEFVDRAIALKTQVLNFHGIDEKTAASLVEAFKTKDQLNELLKIDTSAAVNTNADPSSEKPDFNNLGRLLKAQAIIEKHVSWTPAPLFEPVRKDKLVEYAEKHPVDIYKVEENLDRCTALFDQLNSLSKEYEAASRAQLDFRSRCLEFWTLDELNLRKRALGADDFELSEVTEELKHLKQAVQSQLDEIGLTLGAMIGSGTETLTEKDGSSQHTAVPRKNYEDIYKYQLSRIKWDKGEFSRVRNELLLALQDPESIGKDVSLHRFAEIFRKNIPWSYFGLFTPESGANFSGDYFSFAEPLNLHFKRWDKYTDPKGQLGLRRAVDIYREVHSLESMIREFFATLGRIRSLENRVKSTTLDIAVRIVRQEQSRQIAWAELAAHTKQNSPLNYNERVQLLRTAGARIAEAMFANVQHVADGFKQLNWNAPPLDTQKDPAIRLENILKWISDTRQALFQNKRNEYLRQVYVVGTPNGPNSYAFAIDGSVLGANTGRLRGAALEALEATNIPSSVLLTPPTTAVRDGVGLPLRFDRVIDATKHNGLIPQYGELLWNRSPTGTWIAKTSGAKKLGLMLWVAMS